MLRKLFNWQISKERIPFVTYPVIRSQHMDLNASRSLFAVAPVASASDPDLAADGKPILGMALCLSGGGYRAMVFHLGALWRLNELGLLRGLRRVSSVSGGSITAGLLGLRWSQLGFGTDGVATHLQAKVVDPILALAGRSLDADAVIKGVLLPGSVSDRIAATYQTYLYGDATLQALPTDADGPRFVINATSVQSGALWRFSRPYMGDYLVGRVPNPTVSLATAVTASSAFPPVLSPTTIALDPAGFTMDPGAPLRREPFTREAVLSDGGVYDNLGLETVWKRFITVLVSDGGGKMLPEGEPEQDWAQHSYRINQIIDNQVRSLRKRQLLDAFAKNDDAHDGTYWGIRTHIGDYGFQGALNCPTARTDELANIPTRLERLEPEISNRLVNWGYAVCDAAMQQHCAKYLPTHSPAAKFPFPGEV